MARFLFIFACFLISLSWEGKTQVYAGNIESSIGYHFPAIFVNGHHGLGGFDLGSKEHVIFSAENGPKSIAQGSAEHADSVAVKQHASASQAVFAAKSALAQTAATTAATAQSALIGKNIVVQRLQEEVSQTNQQMQAESQQLEIAQRSAAAAQSTAQQAQQVVNAANVAANTAQATLLQAQQAADEANAELGTQQSMIDQARRRMATLNQQLSAAQVDLQATQAAAQQAENAAQIARSNAAQAAEKVKHTGLEHHGHIGDIHGKF